MSLTRWERTLWAVMTNEYPLCHVAMETCCWQEAIVTAATLQGHLRIFYLYLLQSKHCDMNKWGCGHIWSHNFHGWMNDMNVKFHFHISFICKWLLKIWCSNKCLLNLIKMSAEYECFMLHCDFRSYFWRKCLQGLGKIFGEKYLS